MKTRLSARANDWSPLPTAALHGKILSLKEQGEKIIDLSIGISDRPMPEKGKAAAINAITQDDVPYTAIGGSDTLKGKLQKKLSMENDIECDISEIIASSGAKQAIFESLFVLTNPGDEVALFSPRWPAYTQILNILSLKPVFLDVHNLSSLDKAFSSSHIKVLILNSPHNPTGKSFTKEELQLIAEVVKKYDVTVVADESYEKLNYERAHISFRTLDKALEDKVVTIFSVSQTFSMMGWRLGYAVANRETIRAIEGIQSSITAAASAVTQYATAAIISGELTYIDQLVADFKNRRNIIHAKLSEIDWISCEIPQSGPYFWCDITKLTKNSLEFCSAFLQEKKVAVMPGEAFGSPGWIRVAFNTASIETLDEAVKYLADFGKTYQHSISKPLVLETVEE